MDKKTFSKDITFLSQVLVGETVQNKWDIQPITKSALFYELNQSDPRQARLTFQIMDLWDFRDLDKKGIIRADAGLLYDLMLDFIDVMLIPKTSDNNIESLTTQEIVELKADNFAMAKLGKWMVINKISTFFLELSAKYDMSIKNQTTQEKN